MSILVEAQVLEVNRDGVVNRAAGPRVWILVIEHLAPRRIQTNQIRSRRIIDQVALRSILVKAATDVRVNSRGRIIIEYLRRRLANGINVKLLGHAKIPVSSRRRVAV